MPLLRCSYPGVVKVLPITRSLAVSPSCPCLRALSCAVGVAIRMLQGLQQQVTQQGEAQQGQERQLDILQQWALVSLLCYWLGWLRATQLPNDIAPRLGTLPRVGAAEQWLSLVAGSACAPQRC